MSSSSSSSSTLNDRELVFLILQFLDEEKFKETRHKLERESGFFFNMRYFGDLVTSGQWDEVEKYLSGFTKLDDNRYSEKIVFKIRKHKFFEALDRQDRAQALDILVKELKVFSTSTEQLFKELTQLLTLDDIRENKQLFHYGDTKISRAILVDELKRLIEANPLFSDKLQVPLMLKDYTLRTLINQTQSENPAEGTIPEIETSFINHENQQDPSPVTNPLINAAALPDHEAIPITPAACEPLLPAPASYSKSLGDVAPLVLSQPAPAEHMGFSTPNSAAAAAPLNADNQSSIDVPRIYESKAWKLVEINEPSQCRLLKLPDDTVSSIWVSRLIYTSSGNSILALASNGVHMLWKWKTNQRNFTGKASASIMPQLWQPSSGLLMKNDLTGTYRDLSGTYPADDVSCLAVSKNGSYVLSASGGKFSLFNIFTFKKLAAFMPPPPAATVLAFHPRDNNIIAVGREDSSIQIHNVRLDELQSNLKGHRSRVTGLAFSNTLGVLVSSGGDAQLCVWSMDRWAKLASKFLQLPSGRIASPLANTKVQFHQDETHLLAVHDTHIAIYEAPKLDCLKQWVPRGRGFITYAMYSSDGKSIYASFEDGIVSVLAASDLRMRCKINPTSYLSPNLSTKVYPVVIAAHPSESNQFALGLTDGGVCVLEPLESEGQWGTVPPAVALNDNAETVENDARADNADHDHPQPKGDNPCLMKKWFQWGTSPPAENDAGTSKTSRADNADTSLMKKLFRTISLGNF